MRGPGFEPQTTHFSTFKMCEPQPLGYLTKKNTIIMKLLVV